MEELIVTSGSDEPKSNDSKELMRRFKPISLKSKFLIGKVSAGVFGRVKKINLPKPQSLEATLKRVNKFILFTLTFLFVISLSIEVFALKLSNANTASVTVDGTKQASSAPAVITLPGPTQSNPLFSTYPTWSQDFSTDKSGKLDSHYWDVYQGPAPNGNHEAEYYTDSSANIHISGGALTLEATHQPEPQGYSYGSARIDTSGKVSFLYGRIDITAELPDSVGSWPAAWFLPANNKYEDLSPASQTDRYLNGGEMDLIEEVGFQPNTEYGVVHSLHDLNNPNGVGDFNQINIPNNNSEYNTYSLLWTPSSITYEVNNTPFFTYNRPASSNYTTWPFDQPFFLTLNLALGGSWGGEDTTQFPGNGINNAALPVSMNIKSIYYYSYISQ